MGRPRKITLNELQPRTMYCSCGEPIHVIDVSTESVTCVFCATNMRPIPDGYDEDIVAASQVVKEEVARKKTRKRGRPAGAKNKKTIEREKAMTAQSVTKEKVEKKTVKKPAKKRCGPKKTKESKMNTTSKVKGKRGRKATVGAKVLQFINEQNQEVPFNDILNVYSSERDRLGKKGTDEIEKRNCLSTLYILKRDEKILEIKPKQLYKSI